MSFKVWTRQKLNIKLNGKIAFGQIQYALAALLIIIIVFAGCNRHPSIYGKYSLKGWHDEQWHYIGHRETLAMRFMPNVSQIGQKRDASLIFSDALERCLIDQCLSFKALHPEEHYLFASPAGPVVLKKYQESTKYHVAATFRLRYGLSDPEAISLESYYLPNHYMRLKKGELVVEENDGSEGFKLSATFHVAKPLFPRL